MNDVSLGFAGGRVSLNRGESPYFYFCKKQGVPVRQKHNFTLTKRIYVLFGSSSLRALETPQVKGRLSRIVQIARLKERGNLKARGVGRNRRRQIQCSNLARLPKPVQIAFCNLDSGRNYRFPISPSRFSESRKNSFSLVCHIHCAGGFALAYFSCRAWIPLIASVLRCADNRSNP